MGLSMGRSSTLYTCTIGLYQHQEPRLAMHASTVELFFSSSAFNTLSTSYSGSVGGGHRDSNDTTYVVLQLLKGFCKDLVSSFLQAETTTLPSGGILPLMPPPLDTYKGVATRSTALDLKARRLLQQNATKK